MLPMCTSKSALSVPSSPAILSITLVERVEQGLAQNAKKLAHKEPPPLFAAMVAQSCRREESGEAKDADACEA